MGATASPGVPVKQFANLGRLFPAEPLLTDQLHDQGRDRIAPQAIGQSTQLLPEDFCWDATAEKIWTNELRSRATSPLRLQPLQERMDGGKLRLCPIGINDLCDGLAASGPRAQSTLSTASSASVTAAVSCPRPPASPVIVGKFAYIDKSICAYECQASRIPRNDRSIRRLSPGRAWAMMINPDPERLLAAGGKLLVDSCRSRNPRFSSRGSRCSYFGGLRQQHAAILHGRSGRVCYVPRPTAGSLPGRPGCARRCGRVRRMVHHPGHIKSRSGLGHGQPGEAP